MKNIEKGASVSILGNFKDITRKDSKDAIAQLIFDHSK